MLLISRKASIFKIKEIWFADSPYDVDNCHSVKFNACKNKVDTNDFNCEKHTTITIDLTQDLDKIWKKMKKSSCRYAITRAEKDEIKIKVNQNYNEFFKIYHSFRNKKGLSTISSFLWNPEIEIMNHNGTLFTAEFNNEILSGNFYLEDKNNIRWILGASKRLAVDREKATLIGNANRLIIWEAIKYAKNKGIKEFDLGGYSLSADKDKNNPKYGINRFKESFGGELKVYYTYYKDYNKIYALVRNIYDNIPRILNRLKIT